MTELERRLQAKAEKDRQRAEQIYLAELKMLGENLRRCASKERSSTERAMESLTRPLVAVLRRITLVGVVLGVSLSLGTWGANLALVQWQSGQIESLREERSRLETEIADQRLTLERLHEKTWGGRFDRDRGGALDRSPQGNPTGDSLRVRGPVGGATIDQVRGVYDRTGTSVDGRLDRAGRAVRAGSEANRRAGRNLAKSDRDTDEGFDRVDDLINSARESAHRAGRAVGKASRDLGEQIRRAGRSVAEAVSRLSQFVQDVMRSREEEKRKREKKPERSSGWDRDDGPSR